MDVIAAPFTAEQVDALNTCQTAGWVHPFTCGVCRDNLGTLFYREDDGQERRLHVVAGDAIDYARLVVHDRLLIATVAGWVCPTCAYTQDWAYAFMADREAARRMEEQTLAFRTKAKS